MTLHVTDCCFPRATIQAGIFAGQQEKGRTQELREPERCCWQRGQVSVAKHFINSGPDSPLWLDWAEHRTRIGEQRWLGATFLLLHSRAAGDWLVPRVVQVASGYCRSRRLLENSQDVVIAPFQLAVAAPEGARRWLGWHHCHNRGLIFPETPSVRREREMSARMLPGRQRNVWLIWGSRKHRSSKFRSGEPLTPVPVCPQAHALIFSVPRGKATGEGSWKQQNFTEMIRYSFQIGFNSKNQNKVNIYRHAYSMWSKIILSCIYTGISLFAGWIRNPPRAEAVTGERICKGENKQVKTKRKGKALAWQGILGLLLVK